MESVELEQNRLTGAYRPTRKRLRLIIAGVVLVAVLVVTWVFVAYLPLRSVDRVRSVSFSFTLYPNGTGPYEHRVTAPAFCPTTDPLWNGTVAVFFNWSVANGAPLSWFLVREFVPPSSPAIYWPNDTASGSDHFWALCAIYGFAAGSAGPETVFVHGTWNYTYPSHAPLL